MESSRPGFWKIGCDGTDRDRKNQQRIRAWMLVWMGTWLAILALVKFEILPQGLFASAAAIGSGLLGLGALGAYRRFLREADELRRKIELESLAAALGVGVLGGMTSWLLVRTGSLLESVDPLWVVTAMLFAHGIGKILGHRRYS